MNYAPNTSYGTWCTQVDRYSISVESSVNDAFGDFGPDDYDFDTIVDEYREAINAALPQSVALSGDEFLGPYYEKDQDFDDYPTDEDGSLDIKAIVEDIDLWEIIERNEWLTLDQIGQELLESKAKDPAKAASRALGRLDGLKATYRPHPNSGRPQAVYRRGQVKAALGKRPGQGKRTDLPQS